MVIHKLPNSWGSGGPAANSEGVNIDIANVLHQRGYISLSEHPELKTAVDWQASQGRLVRVLGNWYTTADVADSFEAKVAAARGTYPNGVFVRETAARLSWWPELEAKKVQVAVERTVPRKGFVFERSSIPAELTVWTGQHFVTHPALTVLDLTDTLGGAAIDEALRRRAVTLDDLHQALAGTRGRRGNRERARLVAESRDEPWSELERQAHVLLRQARFPGWVANHPVEIEGRRYFLDLAVPDLKLAAEVDGWAHHKTFESFVADRSKWNDLALDKWLLLHFTANSMDDLVRQMRRAQKLREVDLRLGMSLTV